MNSPAHDRGFQDQVLHFEILEPVRLGMPEMCATGLSETWLWKACGHRHWLALAAAHRLERPDFRDEHGNRLYPAFTTVALHDGSLDTVEEHAMLDFEVTLQRTGRSRFTSEITLTMGANVVAALTIESTFIRRTLSGRNASARRGIVARPCSLLSPHEPSAPFRADSWDTEEGFSRSSRQELDHLVLDPMPDEDFNGVGFLYCASFQAMLARAEWAWFREIEPVLVSNRRRIHYVGNAEMGDRIRATLCGKRHEGAGHATWVELTRESDGQLIAIAFSSRRPSYRLPEF